MNRVLKPGGKLVIIDMEAAEEGLRETEDRIELLRDCSHVRNISRQEFVSLYNGAGYTIWKEESTRIPVRLSAWMELTKTPEAVQRLCEEYNRIISSEEVDPLVVIPTFIHDFLCIHPFNDGNGRMSRLLTTLLLHKNGYVVGKYISLEKKIHDNKDDYYDALQLSSENWHEGKNDDTAFTKYLLGVILSAYRDFEERLEIVFDKKSAIDMVKEAFNVKLGKVTKSDIMELCPSLSRSTVEKALRDLIAIGYISKHGNGPATFYILES